MGFNQLVLADPTGPSNVECELVGDVAIKELNSFWYLGYLPARNAKQLVENYKGVDFAILRR
jgi:hypothetical protein